MRSKRKKPFRNITYWWSTLAKSGTKYSTKSDKTIIYWKFRWCCKWRYIIANYCIYWVCLCILTFRVFVFRRNLTEAIFAETKHIVDNDGYRALSRGIDTCSKNIYNYYREQTNLLRNKIKQDYDELLEPIKLIVFDVYQMLLRHSDEPLSRNRRSTAEPHSFREYVTGMILVLRQINLTVIRQSVYLYISSKSYLLKFQSEQKFSL